MIDSLGEDGPSALPALNDEIENLTATQLKERIRQLNEGVKGGTAQLEAELDEALSQIRRLKKQVVAAPAGPIPPEVMARRREIAAADFTARSQIDAIVAQSGGGG